MAGTNGNASFKEPAVDMSVALAANNLDAVPQLLKDISALGAAAGENQGRLELAEKARQLVRALETPRETLVKQLWAQVQFPVEPLV